MEVLDKDLDLILNQDEVISITNCGDDNWEIHYHGSVYQCDGKTMYEEEVERKYRDNGNYRELFKQSVVDVISVAFEGYDRNKSILSINEIESVLKEIVEDEREEERKYEIEEI